MNFISQVKPIFCNLHRYTELKVHLGGALGGFICFFWEGGYFDLKINLEEVP